MPPKNELLVMLNKTGSITTVADSLGAARINVHGWLKRYGIKRKVVFI